MAGLMVRYLLCACSLAIVTLPNENFVQIINTSTMRAEHKIMVPVKCFGITLIDNDIVLGNEGVIYIINEL
jgi:regulator of RNase E activity RraA